MTYIAYYLKTPVLTPQDLGFIDVRNRYRELIEFVTDVLADNLVSATQIATDGEVKTMLLNGATSMHYLPTLGADTIKLLTNPIFVSWATDVFNEAKIHLTQQPTGYPVLTLGKNNLNVALIVRQNAGLREMVF